MTESGNASKLDSSSFTDFQKELHRRQGYFENGHVKMSGPVNTIFQHRFRKISWYTPIKEKLEATVNDDVVTYVADHSYDHLFKVFMNFMLPALRVNAKFAGRYRIAWTHNIGTNINMLAELKLNDLPLNRFDNIDHDILSQYGYLVKPGFKKHHLISIGSVSKLEQWTTFLPAHQINILQPFFYTKANHLALPLLNSSLSKFRHIYKLRRKILSLLRMQKYDEGNDKWIDIIPNYSVLDGIKDKDATLPVPELWGRYSRFTDEERDWYKECAKETKHEYYYDDLIVCDDENKKTYGDVAKITLTSSTPVKAIFWVGENCDATTYNNYSNYTTNSENINQGWNPCKDFNLKYATSTRITKMSIDHAEREEPWQFPRAPWEPGYNAITFCNDPFSIDGEASVDFQSKNAQLIIELCNTDLNLINPENYESEKDTEILNLDDEEQKLEQTTDKLKLKKASKPRFLLRCRLLVYKKLTYYYEKNKGFTFETNYIDKKQIWYDDEMKKRITDK